MYKKCISTILAAALVFGVFCTQPAMALEEEAVKHSVEQQTATPTPSEADPASIVPPPPSITTTYSYDYDYQYSFADNNWRNGVSGGSDITDMTLTFDRGYDETVNINFTAEISGDTTVNEGTIGAHFGVSFGVSDTYSLDSGVSVVVPKEHHYTILYRPIIAYYKVTEYTYATFKVGLTYETRLTDTKVFNVTVFDHWDFTAVEYT